MRKFFVLGIIVISIFSCKNGKITPEIITDINSNIFYYRIIYQSTLYVENDEIKDKDKIKIKTEYFDRNNNIIKELSSVYGVTYNIYEYDDNGNQISQNIYNEDGELEHRSEFSFNENNKIISTIGYNRKSEYDGESIFLYDYFGNIIQKINFDENNEFNNYIIYAYDINGRCYSTIRYAYFDNFPLVTIYSYKIDGKLSRAQSFGNGRKQSMTEILAYDDEDREIKSISYVYDFDGNEIPSTMDYYEYHNM